MMIKLKILSVIFASLILFSGCEDLLDRPQLDKKDDINYWENEQSLRFYANGYYAHYFVGYSTLWGVVYTPVTGYLNSDDIIVNGIQRSLEITIPVSRTSVSDAVEWIEAYNGPTWNFYWVRKTNIMLDRISSRMSGKLTEEQREHWIGVGRFFRALEYAELARVFGDVPYYDREIMDTELDELYKERTPRDEVMDHVYDDLRYALDNVRPDDGDQTLNRYIVAAYAARLMLHEGTWQKYYYNKSERAKKFLEFAIEAGNYVMGSGKFDIVTDFRSLFASEDLKGNKDCILYRHYDMGIPVSHSIATYCNMLESPGGNANLDLVKSFICADGKPWSGSALPNAKQFDMTNLVNTRDPRFEATFWDKPTVKAVASGLYTCKFIDREGPQTAAAGQPLPAKYISSNNTNDYPVMRYAEVLLNWIEAKAELASLGGTAVTQSDIDASVNKIRNRPLDATAKAKGIKQTAPMYLAEINEDFDINRDLTVSPLIWEIRRERRMEFFFEHSRLVDLRRWHKIDYMNDRENPDLLRGIWVNMPVELSAKDLDGNKDKIAVVKEDGTKIVYKGDNVSEMVGYFSTVNIQQRRAFWDLPGVNVYLAPVGNTQRRDYRAKGYELAQTEGWSSVLPD
ncbi:MAG: RagB/SusD family nutrient uptake outer membrane protein [Prevotella sp.]|jgi:hypothetical protein|nr:RagB/SusD family nutrient uptake outer membrane protein [Prevotella sp.]